MSNPDAPAAIGCPNCRQPMQAQEFERHDHGSVQVDLCFTCAGIWFDHLVSVQLAPSAVIELFKEIHSHWDATRQPMAQQLDCPRCSDPLKLSFDVCKSGRFTYYRCLRGDGRFTPFFQFLREKQFIRSLTEVELARVRAQVRQINCSQCGAPIDIEHYSECQYCHSPVSFLDPEAVEKATKMWMDAEHRRQVDPAPRALGDALLQMQFQHPEQTAAMDRRPVRAAADTGAGSGLDLVTHGIRAIGVWLENIDRRRL